MKKIPSLFKRDYKGNRQVYNEVVEGCGWVLAGGDAIPTVKIDGTACMIQDDNLYKRYDRKRNKKTGEYKAVPDGWIPCEDEPNEHTGHWPGWIPVDADNPGDKWHIAGRDHTSEEREFENGTYELIGSKVQSNPYDIEYHELIKHGEQIINVEFNTFDVIRDYLQQYEMEGIVWHHPDGRMAKIKRRDFGFEWPVKKKR